MKTRCVTLCLLSMSAVASSAWAVTGNQADTFTSGTLSWTQGGTPAVSRQSFGGPGGASDAFLLVSADGSAQQGKLITFNDTQWTGNYISAGINEISLDFLNPGSTTLHMRLALKSGLGNTPGYLTAAVDIPADNHWHHADYLLDASDLTPISSPTLLSTFMTGVGELRILSALNPSLNGDVMIASVGIDNVTAVPEPASLSVLGLGALMLFRRRRR